jgi:isoquinoline 1-oxidoreductase beta subunit
MTVLELGEKPPLVTRRGLLIGGGAAIGLVVAWSIWPRDYRPSLAVAEGEHAFNGYIKIGVDGHVSVVVPLVEHGQGIYTVLAQTVADELGADWRTIAIEAAPVNPHYANILFAEECGYSSLTPRPEADGRFQVTGGSTSLRGFGARCREAGALARAMLCMAAATDWDADWQACDTENGFVVRGNDRVRFAQIAERAASMTPPDHAPFRAGSDNRLIGQSVPRLDLPAKVDGSLNYAADVRLPGMVFASVRHGPLGSAGLVKIDRKAGLAVKGAVEIVETDQWVAAVANTWWAANIAVDALRPRFAPVDLWPEDASVTKALDVAFAEGATNIVDIGDLNASYKGQRIYRADYSIGLAAHAAIEPMTATAKLDGDQLQLWIATQAPGRARIAAADAIGLSPDQVIVHATQVGGSFGRKYETEIAGEVALLAQKLNRPVQLTWSRPEDMMQDRFRPAAKAKMTARIAPARIDGWGATIAMPASMAEFRARLFDGKDAAGAQASHAESADGLSLGSAVLPYGIPNIRIDHAPADIGIPTGRMRGGYDALSVFFTECFVDELAELSGVEPFSFRMGMLGGNARLAFCLSQAASLGGWEGGAQGTGQGLSCHAMLGGHIAILAEARVGDDQRVRVSKLVAVADVGRTAHPDIVHQQIEGGLIFGMATATGNAVRIKRGIASPQRLGHIGLPRLADSPEIIIDIVRSKESSGGVSDLAAAAVAPAIANALHAGSGRRFRSLPLSPVNP